VKARVRRFCVAVPLALLSLASTLASADMTKEQCIDANGKAQDLRREGKLSAARDALRTCASASCPAIVRDDCTKRLDDLERAQPTVIFEAKDGAGNDISVVKVTVDGLPFATRLTGTPLPIEPGEHTFTFEVSGQPTLQKKFVIRESEKGRRERITLGATDTATTRPASASSGAQSPASAPPLSAPPPAGPSSGLGAQRVLALVVGGIGVVGLGLGGAFGLVAISKKSDAENACPGQCTDQSGVTKWSDAKSAGNISTVAFIVGGVALAGGAALWFTGSSESSKGPSAQVGIGPGVVQVRGTW
jgi:hypothetical protein